MANQDEMWNWFYSKPNPFEVKQYTSRQWAAFFEQSAEARIATISGLNTPHF